MRTKLSVASTSIGAALVIAASLPATASAAQPGDLCRIGSPGYEISYGGRSPLGGPLAVGDYVRIEGYYNSVAYFGHTTGQPRGGFFARAAVDQASCRP